MEVYKISVHDTYGNKYGVNRDDTWTVAHVVDKSIENPTLALEYVLEKNLSLPYFHMLTYLMTQNEYDEFKSSFMENDLYIHHCRWFVGKPPMERILRALRRDGVKVLLL